MNIIYVLCFIGILVCTLALGYSLGRKCALLDICDFIIEFKELNLVSPRGQVVAVKLVEEESNV